MYDFSDTEPQEFNFDILDEGYYAVIIEDFKETTTKNGAKMIINTYRVTAKIESGETFPCADRLIWHNIVFPTRYKEQEEPEKAAFMYELIRKFLKTIGEEYKGQIRLEPRRWIGKELAVKIKNYEWAGKLRENVHYVLMIERALKITAKQKKDTIYENSSKTESENFKQQIVNPNDKIPFLS